MLTDNELILLGLEQEMERLSTLFKSIAKLHLAIEDDSTFKRLVEYRDQYAVLSARHDALVTDTHQVPF